MTRADWARIHVGERRLRLLRGWHVIDTESGIVAGRGTVNIGVDITDEGWWLRLWAVVPAYRHLIGEWQVPAIHVPEGFLALCEQMSDDD